eukprot:TRINITY_DN56454_c0_g1_i1.p1 TRINITY_DN56454_c0_g1~~TRINITY_DN56454_c0_g1_i1.p1  ORF type:complete len:449 (+),score=163.92 TRINITY_DN56454_c0_g1_i1:99-1349(+)
MSAVLAPKELFDTVLTAAEEADIVTLEKRREEFISCEKNFEKCVDMNGNTILHKALHQDTKTLRYCVDQLNGRVDARNALGKTALHECAKLNLVDCAAYLLDKGASLCHSEVGSTPFHTACAAGSVEVMELLLKRHEGDKEIIDSMVNGADGAGNYPIHKCAYDGNLRVLEVLLAHGVNIEAKDKDECTAAHIAVKMNRMEFVKRIITEKVMDKDTQPREWDLNIGDNKQNTMLHYAVVRCYHDMVRMLVAAGADINKPNDDGNTPLHVAAQSFQPDSQEWEDLVLDMLRMGANPEAQNDRVQRKPESYVPRNVQYLFNPKEYQKRDELAKKKQEQEEARRKELEKEKAAFKEKIRETHKQREKMRKEVMEERRREDEERQRREEEEERKREEEEAERKREEEEAKKKKGKKKKDG